MSTTVNKDLMVAVLDKYSVEEIANHYNSDQLRLLYEKLTGFTPTLQVRDKTIIAEALKQAAHFLKKTEGAQIDTISRVLFYLHGAINSCELLPTSVKSQEDIQTAYGMLKLTLGIFNEQTQQFHSE